MKKQTTFTVRGWKVTIYRKLGNPIYADFTFARNGRLVRRNDVYLVGQLTEGEIADRIISKIPRAPKSGALRFTELRGDIISRDRYPHLVKVSVGRQYCGTVRRDLVDDLKDLVWSVRRSWALRRNLRFIMQDERTLTTHQAVLNWVRKHGGFHDDLLRVELSRIAWHPTVWSVVMSRELVASDEMPVEIRGAA